MLLTLTKLEDLIKYLIKKIPSETEVQEGNKQKIWNYNYFTNINP